MKAFHPSLSLVAASWLAALIPSTCTRAADWPMWGGTPSRNQASTATGLPDAWDVKTRKNIKWAADLGSQAYGNPVVAGGKVFVGTNNELERNPKYKGDHGVVMCFRESDGKFLWQIAHAKLPSGRVNDWPEQGVCSSAFVEGDRLYYTSNRCQLVCLDTEGFSDGENDGPFTGEKKDEQGESDPDIVWILDMMDELGVFPHNLAVCSPVGFGDLIFENTSNGVDEAHLNIPSPRAPSFIAVNKKTGQVVWEDASPGEKILHGQWSNPSCGLINGRPQVVFAGGDGWVYAFELETGKPIWKFDCNPKDSVYILGGRGTKSYIIATPVIHENKVYIAVGQDPEHGEGPGHLWCIHATGTGDVTETGRVWHYGDSDFHRTLSTVAIAGGLVFASDLSGYLNCLDAATGKPYWKHDLEAAVWGSPYVVDGRVIIGDEDGDVAVFEASKEKKLLFQTNMGSAVYSTPVFANGVLFIGSKSQLFAIAAPK
ncbi:MAG: PQQ-binding-like beta-propeller repeat protein [Planctomycetes bacterium]|nr:PQQ-binding-like beta-propeller repeat protein [Planctomycetota bacterium]